MYRVDLIIQDSRGYTSSIVEGITRLAAARADFVRMRVAMAYATLSGCRDLCDNLEAKMSQWAEVQKEWLLSIDF